MIDVRRLSLLVTLLVVGALAGAPPVYADACSQDGSAAKLVVDDLSAAGVPLPATAETSTHLLIDADTRAGRQPENRIALRLEILQPSAPIARPVSIEDVPRDSRLVRAGLDAHHLSTPPPTILI